MNHRSNRPNVSRALLAVLAALVAAASGATASAASGGQSSNPTRPASGVGVPRTVNVRQLPAGTGSARLQLPQMRPNRSGATALKGARARAGSAPATLHAATTGFAGDSFAQQTAAFGGASGDQGLVPPDNGTAANGSFVVEMLNDSGWIYLRNNGGAGAVKSFDLNLFFGTSSTAGACSGYCVSDPRVVWDGSHWFASALAFNGGLDSEEFVAVTNGTDPTDPTGTWKVYTIWHSHSAQANDPCNNQPTVASCLGDQPRIGVTSDKVALFWDDYVSSQTGPFLQEEGMLMDKSALTSGATLGASNEQDIRSVAPSTGSAPCWFGVVPAYLSTGADVWAVYNDTDATLMQPSCNGDGKVHILRFSGSATSAAPVDTALSAASATTGGSGIVAPQPAPGRNINADDDRVTVAAISGSTVEASANTGCTPAGDSASRVCVRMWTFAVSTPTAPTLAGDVNIARSGTNYFYGAPAFDGSGNLAVVFSRSDTSTDPEADIAGAQSGSLTSFSIPATVEAGASLYREVGFLSECDASNPCRWGDYSGAQTDPCDTSFVWTSGEYATSDAGTNWGTWIAPVTFGGATAPATCAGAPVVTSLSPTGGSPGTGVTITGSNFTGATHVYFGTADAAFSVNSSTQIHATAPAGTGTVDVTVVAPAGQSATGSADQFTYTPAPFVSAVHPNTAPGDNSTTETVTISGSNFSYPATVAFGGKNVVITSPAAGDTATQIVVNSPANTPQVVDVRVTDGSGTSPAVPADKFYYTDGGYTMDAYGGVHPFGVNVPPPARTDGPTWPGWKVARAFALRPDRGSGYVMDAYGGLHGFGGVADPTGFSYWGGWDVARDVALDPCDLTHTSGYTLDAFGGLHPFGPHAQVPSKYAYWGGWYVARSIVLNSCGNGGYTLDAFGGIHPFQLGSNPAPSTPTGAANFGYDYARGIVLTADGQGYTLDANGGVHAFGGATPASGFAYWSGWDIARGITVVPGVAGGYTLDGYGGVHPFNSAPAAGYSGYSGGNDSYRAIH